MENKSKPIVQIIVAVICTILSFTCYFLASHIGITGKFTLMFIASVCMSAIVVSVDIRAAIASYLVLAMAAFAVGKIDITQILYVVVFALYPLLKSIIERIDSTPRMFFIKALVFLLMTFLIIVIKQIYSFKLYLYLIVLIIGFGYDYLLSMAIMIYSFCRDKIYGYDPMEVFDDDDDTIEQLDEDYYNEGTETNEH